MENAEQREAFYDAEIAPALAEIGQKCEAAGLSFLAVCEWEPGEYGRTLRLQEGSGLGIRAADAAARANGNADSLIMALIKHAKAHGHSSLCLKELGVPVSPADNEGG